LAGSNQLPKPWFMIYPYSYSIFTTTSTVPQVCFLTKNRNDKLNTSLIPEVSTEIKLDINNIRLKKTVGIKFDNISAGNYLELIQSDQRYEIEHKTLEK
jgi:hypothetical protein